MSPEKLRSLLADAFMRGRDYQKVIDTDGPMCAEAKGLAKGKT